MECPTCKGTGKINVTAQEWTDDGFTDLPPVEMDCIICSGSGRISMKEALALEKAKDAWCSCGNPSDNADVIAPGGFISHVNCMDCGKLLQVG